MNFEGPQQEKPTPSRLEKGLMSAGEVTLYDGKSRKVSADTRSTQIEQITKEQIADKFFSRENASTEDINLRAAFESLVEESTLSWEEVKNTKREANDAIKTVAKKYLEFWRMTDGSPTEREKRKDGLYAELRSLVRGGIQ